ncbi:MAG: HIT family protein [Anaerolineaceae bacterium]
MQFLRGYCVLQADPVVESINTLDPSQRASFLCDMVLVGDAIMEVTDAYRINYALLGNSDPVLHAHIVPRYLSEPEELRKGLPWSYTNMVDDSMMFSIEHDKELLDQLRKSIQMRASNR